MRIRVRLFAIQRELAGTREVGLELPDGATIADAWEALVARYPALAPGRDFVRFARNGAYADAADDPRGRRRGGDDPAGVGRRDGGTGAAPQRILELRATPFDATILAELTDRLASAEDGAAVGFLGGPA